jgi:predicted nucleotide-binding protein
MPYYHITVSYVSKVTGLLERVALYDLSEKALRKLLVEPYMNGKPFLLAGRPIDPFYVDEIHIYETKTSAKHIFAKAQAKLYSHVRSVNEVVSEIFRGKIGRYVTHKFVTSAPQVQRKTKTKKLGKDIFIVHGRDHKPMKELKVMLWKFGLNPIVLHEQPSGSRTIVEKLEKYSDVGYAFIILTPDDIGISTNEIPTKKALMTITIATGEDQNKPSEFLKPRARQNVVLEFGYFIGKLGRDRVCCLYKGDIELPSDMHGIVYIPFKKSVKECKDKIIKELKAVGYKIQV